VTSEIGTAEERLKVKSAHLANIAPEVIQVLEMQWKFTRLNRLRRPLLTGGVLLAVVGLVLLLTGAPALGIVADVLGAGTVVLALSLRSMSENRIRKLLTLEAGLAFSVREGEKIGGPEVDWQEWRTSANTEEILGAKGHAVGKALVTAAVGAASQLQEALPRDQLASMTNEELYGVTLEIEWWLMHTIDRIAFNTIDSAKRNAFMQGLLLAVAGPAWAIAEAKKGLIPYKRFEEMFLNSAAERSSQYAKCFMAENASDAWKDGELDYELFKTINGLLGGRLPKLQALYLHAVVSDSLTSLKVKALLEMGES